MSDAPSTSTPNLSILDARDEIRERGLSSLFYFNKAALGMKDLEPKFHGRMCDFLSTKATRRVLRAFRASLKTSCATSGKNLWKGFRFLYGLEPVDWQEYPIGILSSTATNARRMSREVGRLFEESPVIPWLYPEVKKGPEWSRDTKQFDLYTKDGRLERRVTMEFFGIEARASSRHFRRLTLDDIHAAEESMESPPAVTVVTDRYDHTDSLLVDPGVDEIDVVGSPSSLHPPDVYVQIATREADRYQCLDLPCYDRETSEPAWPERFPRHVLEAIRRKEGDVKFSFQYMLDPIDELVAEFRMSDFIRYHVAHGDGSPILVFEDGRRIKESAVAFFMTVDLAGWRGEGDSNAILVSGRTADGMEIIRDEWERRSPPDVLLQQIVDFHRRYNINFVGVEEVAYQETLSWLLEKRIAKDRLALTVKPLKPHGKKKELRIRNRQPDVRDRKIAIHNGLVQFMTDVSHFPNGKKHLLDCFAYNPQISLMPYDESMEEREADDLGDYLKSIGEAHYAV